MAITAVPNNVRVLEFRNNANTVLNKSISGKQYVADFGNNFWSFTLETPLMESYDLYDVYGSFFLQTSSTVSNVMLPALNDAAGSVAGASTLPVATSATLNKVGSNQVTVTGASITGTLNAGDLIKFDNHNKVYMITESVTFDGSTNPTITFTPRLTNGVAATDSTDGSSAVQISYDNVSMKVIPERDSHEIQYDVNGYAKFKQSFREVL